jgi:hypothetical protein
VADPVRPEDVEHGTRKGYDWHQTHDRPACADCKAAHAAYIRAWRAGTSAESVAASNRYDAARQRALTRLGKAYPEHYAALLAEELKRT